MSGTHILRRGFRPRSYVSGDQLGMPTKKSSEICGLCRHGKIRRNMQEITFHQWTSKGNVSCTVIIPIGICDKCGAKHWNEETEAIIEDAVKREYDKLP